MDQTQAVETFLADEASQEYLGQWQRLVSTTNWEKGRIIAHWRQALIAAGAPPQAYSDEAWSRTVGNVSSQHVGRLRRVYDRFGAVRNDYPGLYWSHFQATLDWNDAEMWLEGAVQNSWSISQMRYQRWEVLGAPADQQPRDEEIVSSELDEDYAPSDDSAPPELHPGASQTIRDVAVGPDYSQGPDFGDEETGSSDVTAGVPFDSGSADFGGDQAEPVRPFEHLPELPDDLGEAFESFKLAILRHKLAGWQEVSRDAVLATLEALKQLALAPSNPAA
jgi:hypothetical protein